jgi:hypothetical protein
MNQFLSINRGAGFSQPPSNARNLPHAEAASMKHLEDNFVAHVDGLNRRPSPFLIDDVRPMLQLLGGPRTEADVLNEPEVLWELLSGHYQEKFILGFLFGPTGSYCYSSIGNCDYRIIRRQESDGVAMELPYQAHGQRKGAGGASMEIPYTLEEARLFLDWERIRFAMKTLSVAWNHAVSTSSRNRQLLILDHLRVLKATIGYGHFLQTGVPRKIVRSECADLDLYLAMACSHLGDEEHQLRHAWDKKKLMGGRRLQS